jgi:hypothetical protein
LAYGSHGPLAAGLSLFTVTTGPTLITSTRSITSREPASSLVVSAIPGTGKKSCSSTYFPVVIDDPPLKDAAPFGRQQSVEEYWADMFPIPEDFTLEEYPPPSKELVEELTVLLDAVMRKREQEIRSARTRKATRKPKAG